MFTGLELKAKNLKKKKKPKFKKRGVSNSCRELVGNGGSRKITELGETGRDMARSSAALSLLFSAPVRCVGISCSSFPTAVADGR